MGGWVGKSAPVLVHPHRLLAYVCVCPRWCAGQETGLTALYVACANGSEDVVELLLAAGPDTSIAPVRVSIPSPALLQSGASGVSGLQCSSARVLRETGEMGRAALCHPFTAT